MQSTQAEGTQLSCLAAHSIARFSTELEGANLKVQRVLCSRLSSCTQQNTPLAEGGVIEGSHAPPCLVPCMTNVQLYIRHTHIWLYIQACATALDPLHASPPSDRSDRSDIIKSDVKIGRTELM